VPQEAATGLAYEQEAKPTASGKYGLRAPRGLGDAIIRIARGPGAPLRKSHAVALSPIKRHSALQRPL
jgi:hypothetical protein